MLNAGPADRCLDRGGKRWYRAKGTSSSRSAAAYWKPRATPPVEQRCPNSRWLARCRSAEEQPSAASSRSVDPRVSTGSPRDSGRWCGQSSRPAVARSAESGSFPSPAELAGASPRLPLRGRDDDKRQRGYDHRRVFAGPVIRGSSNKAPMDQVAACAQRQRDRRDCSRSKGPLWRRLRDRFAGLPRVGSGHAGTT